MHQTLAKLRADAPDWTRAALSTLPALLATDDGWLTNIRTFGHMPAMDASGALYHQVSETLRSRIASGEYPVGSRLPTEGALMDAFGVGRQTIRAAMDLLERDALIQRFAGRGTFVQSRDQPQGRWTLDTIEDLIESSQARHYEILRAAMVPARTVPAVAAVFGAAPTESLFFVEALRSSAQGPYACSRIHLPRAIGEQLPKDLLHTRPLLLLAEEHAGAVAIEARQVTSSTPAARAEARILRVRTGTPLLVMERTYVGGNGLPITHSLVHARPDRYEQVITFRRRGATESRRPYRTVSPGSKPQP